MRWSDCGKPDPVRSNGAVALGLMLGFGTGVSSGRGKPLPPGGEPVQDLKGGGGHRFELATDECRTLIGQMRSVPNLE